MFALLMFTLLMLTLLCKLQFYFCFQELNEDAEFEENNVAESILVKMKTSLNLEANLNL